MVSHKFNVPHANKNAKERANALLNEKGIGKEEWCELTGFSEGQYYRWYGPNHAHSATTSAQFMHICAVLDWSPTYLYFGLGPARLSACTQYKPVEVLAMDIETNQLVKEIKNMLNTSRNRDE